MIKTSSQISNHIPLTVCIQYNICILSNTVLPKFKENQNIL